MDPNKIIKIVKRAFHIHTWKKVPFSRRMYVCKQCGTLKWVKHEKNEK